jgi:alanine racemase
MVRSGAALYGYHLPYAPAERKAEIEAGLVVEPAVSLRARLIAVREVSPDQGVGYNARFVARRPSRIAVIAAGYADGLLRGLGNRGRVIVRGQFVPLVGTISMDSAMIDVTDLSEAHVGEVATILGTDGQLSQHASCVACLLGTVVQDVLCALGKRVPRFYVR